MNGIGGRTVAEARQRMSYAEFLSWVAFRDKRGSLNGGLRVEEAVARLMALTINIHAGKNGPGYRMYDFAPHIEEPPISIEQAMEAWS